MSHEQQIEALSLQIEKLRQQDEIIKQKLNAVAEVMKSMIEAGLARRLDTRE